MTEKMQLTPKERSAWKRARDRESNMRSAARRKILHQEFIHAVKAEPCTDCGFRYPPYVMDFDHVRGKKLYNIGAFNNGLRSLTRLVEELEKCELVCSNCHREREHQRRIAKKAH